MREKNIIANLRKKYRLNLDGLNIFCQARSKAAAALPAIAVNSGAKRVFLLADAYYYEDNEGISDRVLDYFQIFENFNKIEFVYDLEKISQCDIIISPGFEYVTESVIDNLKKGAVFVEAPDRWEQLVRKNEDIQGSSIFSANPGSPLLNSARYVSMLAMKMLMQADLEIYNNNIMIFSGGEAGETLARVLKNNGADVFFISEGEALTPNLSLHRNSPDISSSGAVDFLKRADAIVFADSPENSPLIGADTGFGFNDIYEVNPDVKIAYLFGNIDLNELSCSGLQYFPQAADSRALPHGAPLEGLGLLPVFDIISASLKAGETAARNRLKFESRQMADIETLKNYLCKIR